MDALSRSIIFRENYDLDDYLVLMIVNIGGGKVPQVISIEVQFLVIRFTTGAERKVLDYIGITLTKTRHTP